MNPVDGPCLSPVPRVLMMLEEATSASQYWIGRGQVMERGTDVYRGHVAETARSVTTGEAMQLETAQARAMKAEVSLTILE